MKNKLIKKLRRLRCFLGYHVIKDGNVEENCECGKLEFKSQI